MLSVWRRCIALAARPAGASTRPGTARSLCCARCGRVHALAPTRSRELDGRQVTTLASPQLAAMIGRQVELAYSRIDADGSLREVRINVISTSPRTRYPTGRAGDPASRQSPTCPFPPPTKRQVRTAEAHYATSCFLIARRAASRRQRATCSARGAEAEPLGERRHLLRRPGSHEPTTAALGDHRARAALFGWLTDVYITVTLRMP